MLKKRAIAGFAAVCLALSLCACAASPSNPPGVPGGQDSAPDKQDSAPDKRDSAPDKRDSAPDKQDSGPDKRDSAPDNQDSVPVQEVELVVFAAASLQETLTELGRRYEAERGGVTLVFNFDSSGLLKTQIQEGAVCDLFLSAGQKQMNQLDASSDAAVNTEGLDCVLQGTRSDILENKVALAVPAGNPAGIRSFADLRAGLESGTVLLAMGNSDVPVGQYTESILSYYGLDEAALAAAGSVTYGSNVKEVTAQVSEAAADCGIIYQTDAYSAGLEVVDTATVAMCGKVVYPAAVLNGSAHPDEARAFLDYLTGEEADAVFSAVGFTPIGQEN